jgi:3-hydroxyisobutyrate dehydrogenase
MTDSPADLGRGSRCSVRRRASSRGIAPGQIFADMTTGDPGETREMAARLAEKAVQMIDAPVSGGPYGANAGTIAIMVGAPAERFAQVQPIFATISSNIFHTGDVGTCHVMKLSIM